MCIYASVYKYYVFVHGTVNGFVIDTLYILNHFIIQK